MGEDLGRRDSEVAPRAPGPSKPGFAADPTVDGKGQVLVAYAPRVRRHTFSVVRAPALAPGGALRRGRGRAGPNRPARSCHAAPVMSALS